MPIAVNIIVDPTTTYKLLSSLRRGTKTIAAINNKYDNILIVKLMNNNS